MKLELSEWQQKTVDANGVAEMVFSPAMLGEKWTVNNIAITNTGSNIPRVDVYKNNVHPANRFTYTYNGNSDNDPATYTFQQGDRIIVRFTLASVGSISTASINGTKELPGQGFVG